MICVKDILALPSFQDVTLVSGRKGIYRPVSWPTIITTPDIREWLTDGTIVMASGVGLTGSAEELCSLLEQIEEKNAGFLLVLLSEQFVHEIPSEALKRADELQIPLITAPWDFHFAPAIGELATLINGDSYRAENSAVLLSELLLGTADTFSPPLQDYIREHRMTSGYAVLCVEFPPAEQFPAVSEYAGQRDQCIRSFAACLREHYSEVMYISRQQTFYFLVRAASAETRSLLPSAETLYEMSEKYFASGVGVGAGRISRDAIGLRRSAREAAKSAVMSVIMEKAIDFDSMGLFQLLMDMPDQERVRQYAVDFLKPLLDYDRENGKDLLRTLEIYLYENCNAVQAAQRLHIHRNTILYQLNRIRELLGSDMEKATVRNQLMNALIIYRYSQR